MPVTPDVVGSRSDAVFFVRAGEAPVVEISQIDGIDVARQFAAKILLPGPKGSLLELRLTKGDFIPRRRSPHHAIWYLVKGEVAVSLGGRDYIATSRDAWSSAPGTEAALEAVQDSVILEWMSPPRLVHKSELLTWGEALPGNSHLFVKWDDVEPFLMERMEGETVFGPPDVDIKHTLKIMLPGPYGSLLWNTHRKGKWALHTHHHHWVVYLITGQMKEKFGGDQEFIAEPGDIWAAQSGAEHCTEALKDNEIVEFAWPAPMLWRGITHSWEPRG